MFSYRMFSVDGFDFGLNYGLNKVRFPAPLPVGSKVRMRMKLASVDDVPGGAQFTTELTFEREGEAEFRRREREAVLELLGPGGPEVIALGGGAVESEEVRATLGGHVCVWCEVDEETAWERASRDSERPLAADRDQFARRFAARAPLYEGLARAILPANARDAAAEAAPAIAESEPTTQEGVPHLLVRESGPGDHLRGTSPRCSPKP